MEIERFSLPLSEPLPTASGTIDAREGFLVTVERDGVRGVGEATPLPGWTESLEACRNALQSVAEGRREVHELDPEETPAARHAVTLAEADLAARKQGVPLAAWLAEDPAETVPVNATIGDSDRTATVEAARAALDAGFECLKVKVGNRSVGADLERLHAVDDIAESASLRVDTNGAWDREAARDAIDGLADHGVTLVEQPLPPDDLAGHAELRGAGVEIALDESLRERGLEAILESDAADVAILKPMAIGGIERARDVALRAREHGVDVIVTTTIDGVVARTAALHLAGSLGIDRACGLATADRLAGDVATDPAPVEGGHLRVPDGPGIGVVSSRN